MDMDMDWSNIGVRTMKLPANLFNQASPTIVLVFVEEIFQYFVDNQQPGTMPLLLAEQAHPGTETVSV
jgi:hypothetical protein